MEGFGNFSFNPQMIGNNMNMMDMNMNNINVNNMNMNNMNNMNMNNMNMNNMNNMNMNNMNNMNMNNMNNMNMNNMNNMNNINVMMNMNNNNCNQPMNIGGNAEWMTNYTNPANENIIQNIQNSYNPGNRGKINFFFKMPNGKIFNILFDYGKTVEDLIQTFFKRVDKEELFTKGGVSFIHNALQLSYHIKIPVENFFKNINAPTIMVLDVNNLIGA